MFPAVPASLEDDFHFYLSKYSLHHFTCQKIMVNYVLLPFPETQSKRIGHFFFWYLRSEVAGCPFFRQRMAVILEAYLLGCGEAMLTEFQRQVQVVNCLHDVAITVKELYPDKTDLPSTGKVWTTLP